MSSFLVTGFPGFLASGLLPRLLGRAAERDAVCLVQPAFADLARRRVSEIASRSPNLRDRIRVISGDITQPDLGTGAERDALLATTREIYHLAAIYDLAVAREPAMRVNVEGTRHVLAFAFACRSLERLHYVSTCYVSGRYDGVFTEAQLEEGQTFNNVYEESKYLAEVLVRDAMSRGLPATIYRPAVVVGDSRTGATQKYDGPYATIQWLLRQPRVAVMPLPIGARTTELNLVPCDFVFDAMSALAARAGTAGQTFHLADPRPMRIPEMIEVLASAAGRRVVTLPVPFGLARAALRLPGIPQLSPVQRPMLDYTVHRARYDTAVTTQVLGECGISCPPFAGYAAQLVAFVRAHSEDPGPGTRDQGPGTRD